MKKLSKILKKGAVLKAAKLNPDCPKVKEDIAKTIAAQEKILALKYKDYTGSVSNPYADAYHKR